MATKPILESSVPAKSRDTSKLLDQYGCGPFPVTGTNNALCERHLLFDNVIDPVAVKSRQSIWLDNITRDLLDTGTLQHYIHKLSVTGPTSNLQDNSWTGLMDVIASKSAVLRMASQASRT